MNTIKKIIIDKKYRNSAITEEIIGTLKFSSGIMAISGPLDCFANSYSTLSVKIPSGAKEINIYEGYKQSKKEEYATEIYARIELSDDPICDVVPGEVGENSIITWDDWEPWGSQLPGENYTAFCDVEVMKKIDTYIKSELNSDYSEVAKQFIDDFEFADGGFTMHEIGKHEVCSGYSSNAEFTLFFGLNSSKQVCSIIIDIGQIKSRLA